MQLSEIIFELNRMGNANTKKVLMRHGAREPFFGVKTADLKSLQKQIKKDYELSLSLFRIGNSDAMYLAGLISDPAKMMRQDLQEWAEKAYWPMLSEYAVAWTAAESPHGWSLALEWIDSAQENIASAGWATLSSLVAIREDSELDLVHLERLLDRVAHEIHDSANRVRYTMNGFVISAGCYVATLKEKATQIARQIGRVNVDMGGTACQVPDAVSYIDKVKKMGRIGKKRKTAKC